MFDIQNRDYSAQIFAEMQLYNLHPYSMDQILVDGEFHRYRVSGDTHSTKNGWLIAFNNYIGVVCVFGSWKTGARHVWCSTDRAKLTASENAEIFKHVVNAKKQFSIRKADEQSHTAETCLRLWGSFIPANPYHPYLLRKRISPFTARQAGNDLILPIVDCDNKLWSMQYIDSTGRKLFFAKGAKKGNFIPVHGCLLNEEIGIAEGFATAATIAKLHPHMCVVAAMDAGNLEHVAVAIRDYKPYANITIFGDDDRLTTGNPGSTKARIAAISASAKLCLPTWPLDAPNSLTDFNDLACFIEDKFKEIENDE